jgi:hypothetical protein
MLEDESFAERSVDLLKLSGQRVSFRVEFGPISLKEHGYYCRVQFHGWGNSPPDVHGQDSLDSFLHAVTLVHGILHEFVQQGGRVVYPGTDNDYGLEHFVSSPEWQRVK